MAVKYTVVARVEDVPRGGNRAFEVDGQSILLCSVGDEIHAIRNMCTHQLAALEGGAMRGHFLFCPLHGARFDVRDGSTRGKLTKAPVATWPVRIVDGMVEVGTGPSSDQKIS